MTYIHYDNRNTLVGAVRELAAKKLGASDKDTIEFGEYTWDSGYCETCSYTEYDFTVLLNGEVVYDSKNGNGRYSGSVFERFQNWLTSD